MEHLGSVSTDRIVQAFRGDSKVLTALRAEGAEWPEGEREAFKRLTVLDKAERPVDNLLILNWHLFRLTADEVLRIVFPVWQKPGTGVNHSWTMGEMVAALQAGTFKVPDAEKRENVKIHGARFKTAAPQESDLGIPIGYWVAPDCIHLEDGTTRLTAAAVENALPSTVKIYLGCPPNC